MAKIYLTTGQAAGIYSALTGNILNNEMTIADAEFGQSNKTGYKSAKTFGDFVDVNHIEII